LKSSEAGAAIIFFAILMVDALLLQCIGGRLSAEASWRKF